MPVRRSWLFLLPPAADYVFIRVCVCVLMFIIYIVESEILKNTQRDIFHIFTSEDIDHVTICF